MPNGAMIEALAVVAGAVDKITDEKLDTKLELRVALALNDGVMLADVMIVEKLPEDAVTVALLASDELVFVKVGTAESPLEAVLVALCMPGGHV